MAYNHIHFVGIKGVGMTPLAIAAKEAGKTVTGSDIEGDFITAPSLKKVGITPFVGFSPEHINGADLVITTGAHGGFDNIEVKAAKERGIPAVSHGEALGAFMDGKLFDRPFQGIAVAGTHGKTTTTALITTIFMDQFLDPSYIIGTGSIPSLPFPGHFGHGKYFVVEADEYATEPKNDTKARFLWLHTEIAVITNIEHDHPDIYPALVDVMAAFLTFAEQIKEKGVLVACGDDPNVSDLLKTYQKPVITYGFSPKNDYVITHLTTSKEHTFFHVIGKGTDLGEFAIRIFGEHNALNAVAALIVSLECGLPIEKIKQSLTKFAGSKRRFELIGTLPSGALLYDDYAHHPTEIMKTLQAARMLYPKKKIVAVFQPHTYSRTKELFSDFTNAFTNADTVVLTDIFASAREAVDTTITSEQLAHTMKEKHPHVIYQPALSDVIEYLKKSNFDEQTVIITIGAGDIYTVKDALSVTNG